MSDSDEKPMRQWVSGWQAAGPLLQRLRHEALCQSDTALVIESLSDAFESALRHSPRSTTSGLVAQQFFFKMLRE